MFAPVAADLSADAETVVRLPTPGDTCPDAHGSARAAPLTQLALPGYEILGELGRGTMGVVYRARHLRLNREVALKVVLDGPHSRPEDLVRFLGEAEVMARCQHPHIVAVYESGWHGGRPYLAMELVEGGSLLRAARAAPLAPRRAAELVRQLARAVRHAHERGIVHRDLKSANVLLTADDTPKITDFGLAKRLGHGDGLTETGVLLGTPGYMAPEQALGRAAGPATDIYALGAILYELLTGEPPFRSDSLLRTLEQVVSAPPRRPGALREGVGRDLEAICLKCLQKEPQDRYTSAEALAEDLGRFLAGRPVLARPASQVRRALSWVRRHPGLAGITAGVILGATAALTVVALLA